MFNETAGNAVGRGPSKVSPAPAERPPIRNGEDAVNDLDHALQAALVEACGGFSPVSLWRAWMDWAVHMAVSPGRRLELAGRAIEEAARATSAAATPQAANGDKRFRDPAWRQWPFSLWAENFLAGERWWDEATRFLHGADPHSLALLNFVGRQALDSIAPTNFLLTNPAALTKTRQEFGANLVRGAANFWSDFARARRGERPNAATAWAPGKTVALTPGVVVKRTRLAEVIHTSPRPTRFGRSRW